MAVESYSTQLERVQTAIAAIESGSQEMAINGRRLTRGDLSALYKREARLRKAVERSSGKTVRQVVPR